MTVTDSAVPTPERVIFNGRVRTPEGVANAKARDRARQRAMWRLRELHLRQYQRLLDEEMAKENVTTLKRGARPR